MRGRSTGAWTLPPAVDGFIKEGRYTSAGQGIVYADFSGQVHRIGPTGRWHRIHAGPGTTMGTMAMAMAINDGLLVDMVHFIVTRTHWALQVRHDRTTSEPVADGVFASPLELNRDYEFEIEAIAVDVSVRVPGAEVTTKIGTTGLLGGIALWERYHDPEGPSAGVIFDFDTVWADEIVRP